MILFLLCLITIFKMFARTLAKSAAKENRAANANKYGKIKPNYTIPFLLKVF